MVFRIYHSSSCYEPLNMYPQIWESIGVWYQSCHTYIPPFPHVQGLTRCNGYKTQSNNRQIIMIIRSFWFFIKFTLQKLLQKQELPCLEDYDNRFSQKFQNVPQKLRITSTCCEINNAVGPQWWTVITIIAQYNNRELQTNMINFKLCFHSVHSAYDYRVVIVFKFLNPVRLWLAYFSKDSYQDSQM